MSISIRRLGATDVAAYRVIRLEALRYHPEAFASSVDDFLQRSEGEILRLLEDLTLYGAFLADGTLAGIAAFLRAESGKEHHRGWLLQVYVRPEHRGAGLGKALIEHLVANLPSGVLQLHLGVWSENQAAIALYQKLGFAIYGTEPRYLFVNGRFIDEHLMVRFLDREPVRQQGTDRK